MALILLSEYAEKHGRALSTTTQKARRGGFRTARKIGNQWFIDADEPYGDNRITCGKYIGFKQKMREKEFAKKQKQGE